MATLYLDRKGASLRLEGDTVVPRVGEDRARAVPIRLLDGVVVAADSSLSSGLLTRLAAEGVPVSILNTRDPESSLHIAPWSGQNGARRLRQYEEFRSDEKRVPWARRLVRAKLASQMRLLVAARRQRADAAKPLFDGIATLRGVIGQTRGAQPFGLDQLRGLEGAGAAAYFHALESLFPPSMEFHGRNRRPPRDPVNVCLSLGYTLIHAEALRQIGVACLDPFLGFLHDPQPGRASLACDLVEIERARVDRWVWTLVRERTLRTEHFQSKDGRCLLGKAGRGIFYQEYELFRTGTERRFRRWVRVFVKALYGAAPGAWIPAFGSEETPNETTLSGA
ncbi:MAG TPA: CRISPR-associated endonuclease Cas1 [Paludibaculum sp.]|jgi:CRISPR-associated protein Cas1